MQRPQAFFRDFGLPEGCNHSRRFILAGVAVLAVAPVELPVGVVMGALGAPFFLYLLRSAKNM
ncbi:hypothetical protein [Paenibacillus agri]|uniref:hypothetical protein n=1 Tax=Paenibacillus agri TaxID=2744309 RepID=UPI001C3000B4|nr:hypothetical protein [Paenibacillus agri]